VGVGDAIWTSSAALVGQGCDVDHGPQQAIIPVMSAGSETAISRARRSWCAGAHVMDAERDRMHPDVQRSSSGRSAFDHFR